MEKDLRMCIWFELSTWVSLFYGSKNFCKEEWIITQKKKRKPHLWSTVHFTKSPEHHHLLDIHHSASRRSEARPYCPVWKWLQPSGGDNPLTGPADKVL